MLQAVLTSPKSSTLTKSHFRPQWQVRMFEGLTSRWMRPVACASASESQAWIRMWIARSGGTGP